VADNIKLTFTYVIALVVIVGGLYMLYQTRLDPPEADVQGMRLLLSGFIGMALQYVFNRETATATARQVERTYNSAMASQPTTTVTSGPPATATITPTETIP
jgi:hypothetical protein